MSDEPEEQHSNTGKEYEAEPTISQLSVQEETFTEAAMTEKPAVGESVTAEIIKDSPKPKRFNLIGELIEGTRPVPGMSTKNESMESNKWRFIAATFIDPPNY